MKSQSLLRFCFAITFLFAMNEIILAQSFQNTFDPAGDDNYVAGTAVNGNYWVIGNTNSFAPSIGTEHVLFSQYSGATGASVSDQIYFDNANKDIQYTATDIQAGYSQLTSSSSNSIPPLPCSITFCSGAGPNVNAIKKPDSKNYFFVTGFFNDPQFGVRRLFIMKLSSTGAILWTRINQLSALSVFDEAGVSVESCPNGDVMAVSAVTYNGVTFPAVTRLSANGNWIWRFFYPPSAAEPTYHYNPHQSCLFRGRLNGNIHDPIGIAITGVCSDPAVPGTSFFVMRVAYNGALVWKCNYPLILPNGNASNDVGWDIMTEAEVLGAAGRVDNFVVTGLSNANGVGPVAGALGFLSRVNVNNGAFVNCYRFGMTTSTSTVMYGQGIYQVDSLPRHVVITGGVNDELNGIISDTYLLEMDIINGALISVHHYPLTTPNYFRTESVVTIKTGYPTTGYFLSTNAFDPYAAGTLTDGHVIKTDIIGRVNGANCLSDTLTPKMDSVLANMMLRCADQKCDTMISKVLKMKTILAPHVLCWNATKLEGSEESILDDESNALMIYPNPALDGDRITVTFSAINAGNYKIEVMNVRGDVVREFQKQISEGTQSIDFSADEFSDGIYLVRITDGSSSMTGRFIRSK